MFGRQENPKAALLLGATGALQNQTGVDPAVSAVADAAWFLSGIWIWPACKLPQSSIDDLSAQSSR